MIRRATPADVQPITDMIYELADYQKALDECTVKAEQIGEALFGPAATAFAHVAVNSADDVVGMALWFRNFSTWDGAHGIYLEDLYVKPSQRGSGHGKLFWPHSPRSAPTTTTPGCPGRCSTGTPPRSSSTSHSVPTRRRSGPRIA